MYCDIYNIYSFMCKDITDCSERFYFRLTVRKILIAAKIIN